MYSTVVKPMIKAGASRALVERLSTQGSITPCLRIHLEKRHWLQTTALHSSNGSDDQDSRVKLSSTPSPPSRIFPSSRRFHTGDVHTHGIGGNVQDKLELGYILIYCTRFAWRLRKQNHSLLHRRYAYIVVISASSIAITVLTIPTVLYCAYTSGRSGRARF